MRIVTSLRSDQHLADTDEADAVVVLSGSGKPIVVVVEIDSVYMVKMAGDEGFEELASSLSQE